jgi:hypothetical protein
MTPLSVFILGLVTFSTLLGLAACDGYPPVVLTNTDIVAAKVQCEEAGMKVQVHLRNSHPVSAVCVPKFERFSADQVQHP